MSKKLPVESVLSQDHLCAIGLVVAEWSRAERTIFLTLSQLSGLKMQDDMTQATGFVVLLASGMDARTSMGILQGLVRKLDDASIAEFDKIKNRFERLYKRRNVVAHSNWREGKRPKSISATALKSVGDVRLEVSEYTALEMIAVAHRIHAFRSDIVKFFRARGLWKTAPSPKKPTSPNPQSTGETE